MLRQFAESPDRYTTLSTDVERFISDRMCLIQGPTWAAVSDVHTDDVEELVAETRELVPVEKTLIWWIGPSCEPTDLHEQLQALGHRRPLDRADWLHAMVSTSAPPESPGVDIRRVETYEGFLAATHVAWEAFGIPEERRAKERPHLRTVFDATQSGVFLAFLDDEPVGVGRSIYSERGVFLIGGAVLEHARGRGVYRALVRARWDDAVERGTPGMIVEALPDTSYPILKRIGFEEVCIIRRLEDPR